jgi:hypothetical protein
MANGQKSQQQHNQNQVFVTLVRQASGPPLEQQYAQSALKVSIQI